MMPGGRDPRRSARIFVQADLGRTLQFMVDQETAAAKKGREAGLDAARASFYEGDIAKAIAKFHREEGGFITEEDLRNFKRRHRAAGQAAATGASTSTPAASGARARCCCR